jgi:hypothetical protein
VESSLRKTAFILTSRTWLALLLVFLLLSCEKEPEWERVSLPDLPNETITLSVASVVNPRFPELTDMQLQKILDKTAVMVRQHFGLSVSFKKPVSVSIESFFNYLKDNVKKERGRDIVKFSRVSKDEIRKMRRGVYKTLGQYWNDREVVADYARPYLLTPYEGDDFKQLARALVDTLLQRLQYWQTQKAKDGKPVINNDPYNEWVWWDSIGYGDMPYDVVITNQIVASAEVYDMSVHSSIRGGITAGTTTYSEQSQFKAYTYIMVYPMLNDSDMLTQLRNDEHYTDEQVVTYSAALLTHELGHLLLHLGHPFGNQNCVMSPTPLLKYREWYEGLDAAQCLINSEEMMTPGIARLEYRPDW